MGSTSGSMLFEPPACSWMVQLDRILDSDDLVSALTRDVAV